MPFLGLEVIANAHEKVFTPEKYVKIFKCTVKLRLSTFAVEND